MKFIVIPESKTSWFWELRSAQDFLVLRSPSNFTTKFQAMAQIKLLRSAINVAAVFDLVGTKLD